MAFGKSVPPVDEALRALEAEVGEPILLRTTGRFLGGRGFDSLPLDSWGLVCLTPTRVLFRHFAQAHPLFGGKDAEVRWESSRRAFDTCEIRKFGFWSKFVSGTTDHVSLSGPGLQVQFETSDPVEAFENAWNAPPPAPRA